MVQPVSFTRLAVAISIAVHVAAVAVSLGYAGAGLFNDSVPEAVPVSLVTPDDLAEATPPPILPPPQETAKTSDFALRLSSQQTTPAQPSKSPPPTAAQQQPAAPQMAQPLVPQPAYATPKPDLSLRYQVDLGLKALSAAPATEGPRGGTSDFDDQAVSRANVDASGIAAFRRHLKECGTLPATVQPDDKVVIVLRATFMPDGRLANAPALLEASASAKGPALMQAAIAALQMCQPHTALPADKFPEWRVLDLRFTPQDFSSG